MNIRRSGWVALRVFPSSHTNPIFLIVDGQPIRSRRSAQWFLSGIDQLWSQKERTYDADEKADARSAYQHAKDVYRKLLAEAAHN